MSTLKQYLKTVADMEMQLYTQNQLYWNLRNQADRLGIAAVFEEPNPPKFYLIDEILPKAGYAVLVCLVPSILITFFAGIFDYLKHADETLPFFLKCYVFLFVLLVLMMVIFDYLSHLSSAKTYREKLAQYKQFVTADQQRVERELIQKDRLEKECISISAGWNETKNALDALYALGIIHEAYHHNVVAVATFYDYLDKEICDTLIGPNGAYLRYENDEKIGLIITKLDIIINKLDEITSIQYTIASLMRQANQTLSRIEQSNQALIRDITRIADNVELIEYNTRCAKNSNDIMAHLMIFDHLKK